MIIKNNANIAAVLEDLVQVVSTESNTANFSSLEKAVRQVQVAVQDQSELLKAQTDVLREIRDALKVGLVKASEGDGAKDIGKNDSLRHVKTLAALTQERESLKSALRRVGEVRFKFHKAWTCLMSASVTQRQSPSKQPQIHPMESQPTPTSNMASATPKVSAAIEELLQAVATESKIGDFKPLEQKVNEVKVAVLAQTAVLTAMKESMDRLAKQQRLQWAYDHVDIETFDYKKPARRSYDQSSTHLLKEMIMSFLNGSGIRIPGDWYVEEANAHRENPEGFRAQLSKSLQNLMGVAPRVVQDGDVWTKNHQLASLETKVSQIQETMVHLQEAVSAVKDVEVKDSTKWDSAALEN
ncbi:hypothetical protein HDV05_004452 [Chytridiales sp. JEL 0842]|nr:hypothetical protein HDV05_004452 [Chytridiales sp. JEL 0842]